MKILLAIFAVPLLAAQTVNLLPFNSSNFAPNWQKSFLSLGAGTILAPDGISQAQSLDGIADPNAQVHLIQIAPVQLQGSGSANLSASIFVKAGALHQVVLVNRFTHNDTGGAVTGRFDLSTAQVILTSTECCVPFSSFSPTVTDAGNGWLRIGMSVTTDNKHKFDSAQIFLQLEQPSGGPYLDTTGQTGLVYLWGAQIDKGASPLPYQAVP